LTRRGDDAGIGREGLRPPDALEPLLVQHPQELGLQRRAQGADLVHKQGAAGRQLQAPRLPLGGAGARPALVAEELDLQPRLWKRRAMDDDERPLGPQPLIVEEACDQILAGATLAGEQDRGRRA
jgi:hypothetical protein